MENGRLTFDWAYDENIIRQADLSGYDNATLSFDWQTDGLDDGEAISVLISQDGFNFTDNSVRIRSLFQEGSVSQALREASGRLAWPSSR